MFNTGLLSGSHRVTHIEKTVIHLKNIQKTIPLAILSSKTNVFSVSDFRFSIPGGMCRGHN
jgi:hypothetical protein